MNKQEIYDKITEYRKPSIFKKPYQTIAILHKQKNLKTETGLNWNAKRVKDFYAKYKKSTVIETVIENKSAIIDVIDSQQIVIENVIDIQQIVSKDITENITELDKANANKELEATQDITENITEDRLTVIDTHQNDIETVIENKSAIIDVIDSQQIVIENVIDIQQIVSKDITENTQNITENTQSITEIFTENAQDTELATAQDITEKFTDNITEILTENRYLKHLIAKLNNEITELITENTELKNKLHPIEKKYFGWTLNQERQGFFNVKKSVNGQIKTVYIGKIVNKDIIKEKLLSKGFDVN